MDDVWIFGDSFVDLNWHNDVAYSWVEELSKNYNVRNRALMGTGPEYSLRNLRNALHEFPFDNLKNTCLIFVCSGFERLNLNFWNTPQEQVMFPVIASGDTNHRFKYFAKDVFKYYIDFDWLADTELKYYCTLKHLSQYFKQTLYWQVTPRYPINQRFIDSNPSNFCFPETGLNDLSLRDNGGKRLGPVADERRNHFSKINHQIIYNQLVEWIETGAHIDTSKIVDATKL